MRLIKEQVAFMATIGMLVVGMLILIWQTQLYQYAYRTLGGYLSHPFVMVETKE